MRFAAVAPATPTGVMPSNAKLSVHRGQRLVMKDHRRFRVVVAGRRWGKTRLSLTEILKEAGKPKRKIWYVAPTYRMARGIMWQELIDAIPPKLIIKVNETLMLIRLVNGTMIELKGADKPDSLRGVGLHLVVLDEVQDMKFDTWNKALRPTLASTRGRALFIGTPKAFNWLHDIYVLGQRGDTFINAKGKRVINDWKSWQFPTIMSPFIPASEVEAARNDMDERSFRQEFEASFETMSGRVYYSFDRKLHVGNYAFDPTLPIWLGQDFNIDPMSAVLAQYHPKTGELWVYDEIVMFGSNSQEAADEFSRRHYKQLSATTFYPDPAGNNRSHGRGESDVDIFREAGIRRVKVRRKHPKVSDRINSVNRLLKTGDGSIRLRIDHRCKSLIEALEQTIYKEGTREVDKSLSVEHSADALGYMVELEFPLRNLVIGGLSL